MKVCKFGGTSMASAQSILNVKSIIESDSERKYVVVSAPGKRFSSDIKITDMLYGAYEEKVETGSCRYKMAIIRERFVNLAKDLNLDIDMNKYIDEVEENILKSTSPDYAASRGEYLSAVIMSAVLGYDMVDAGDVIKFKHDGTFDSELTNDLVSKYKGTSKGIVFPGFYGRMPDKSIKTFTRGGSDFTGAIIARGVKAKVYENWTDVNGFLVTDPRLVDNPCHIEVLSYEELRELSYMGAGVLHPDSIFPVQIDKIPINIRNTFEPNHKGTFILHSTQGYNIPKVTGIAGRKGNTTISLKKAMMNSEIGFCRKVLSVLERNGLSVEHVPTGIDTMSIVLSDKGFKGLDENKLVDDIRGAVNPDHIEVTHSLALIAVVGHGMANSRGVAATLFTALYKAGVNVRMIDQGSSELNIIVGVEEKDYNASIKAIYNAFFN
ncbi:MAG: aspartate kinase [Clostridia bacterium]|nr:aspartate kinase [Clostridia bacterium]